MTGGIRFGLLAIGLVGAALSLGADPIEVRVASVWQGLEPGTLRQPYWVRVKNNTGRDAQGVLTATNPSDSVRVPLDIGRGGTKQLPIYLVPGYEPSEFTYSSNLGNYRIAVNTFSGGARFRMGMIADNSGELQFLQARKDARGNWTQDPTLSIGYCPAEDAPDRPVGYFLLDVLFLGEGAERLRDPQVDAIHRYVLQGGRVVLVGGGNSPLLSDPRWKGILPIQDASPATVDSLPVVLAGGAKIPVAGPITVMGGRPAPGVLTPTRGGGRSLAYVRPVGLGSVVFLAFNPFETPLAEHPNRRQIVFDALRAAMYGVSSRRVFAMAMGEGLQSNEYAPYSYTSSPNQSENQQLYAHTQAAQSFDTPESGPFSYRPIPASTIGWILVGYFVAVVPLNFLVLRLLKRMELAWVTTPLLTAVCAYVLMGFTRGLYAFDRVRATSGVLYQDNDAKMAGEVLKFSFFFPRGGTYDLTLPGVDQLLLRDQFGGTEDYRYMYRGPNAERASLSELDSYDDGAVKLDNVAVRNLAFLECVADRPKVEPLKIRMDLRLEKGEIRGQVFNDSAFVLERVGLVSGEITYALPDLAPGKSAFVLATSPRVKSANPLISSGRRKGQVALFASIEGYTPERTAPSQGRPGRVLVVCTQAVGGTP